MSRRVRGRRSTSPRLSHRDNRKRSFAFGSLRSRKTEASSSDRRERLRHAIRNVGSMVTVESIEARAAIIRDSWRRRARNCRRRRHGRDARRRRRPPARPESPPRMQSSGDDRSRGSASCGASRKRTREHGDAPAAAESADMGRHASSSEPQPARAAHRKDGKWVQG